MITSEISSKYAKALFSLAKTKEEHEAKLADLRLLVQAFTQPVLMAFFTSPQVDKGRKKAVLEKVLQKQMNPQLLSFLLLLVSKGRFVHLPAIVKEYSHLFDEQLGIVQVQLVTAVPTEPKDVAELKKKLDRKLQKEVRIQNEVDPRLLGGGLLVVGNQMVDFSLKNKLKKLKGFLQGYRSLQNPLKTN